MARSTARKRALNTLYEADEKGQDILSLLAERIARPGAQTPLPDYAVELVRGVSEHNDGIDRQLDTYSTQWTVPRMAVVDRNILRIAVWEILFNDEVPDRVAIDEALSLAKTLSDDETPAFVHGLLSAISASKDEALADIKAAEEKQRDEERKRAALSAPTAPGFLTSGGISGHGDGEDMQWDDAPRNSPTSDKENVQSDPTGGSEPEASSDGQVRLPETEEDSESENFTSTQALDVQDAQENDSEVVLGAQGSGVCDTEAV